MLDINKFDVTVRHEAVAAQDKKSRHINVFITVSEDLRTCADLLRVQGIGVSEGEDSVLIAKVSVEDLQGILSSEQWVVCVQGDIHFNPADGGPSPDGFE